MTKQRIQVGDFPIGPEEKAAVRAVLDSGRISEGKATKEFEKRWARYIGTKYAVAVNSGTSALIAGLLALIHDGRFKKVRPGAKVITSPVTYIATSNAIKLAGMEPVYVDINKHDFTLKCDEIEDLLEKENAKEYAAILPVHLMGYPNDMDRLKKIAHKYDLVIFEDSAQAHGTLYRGKKTGSLSLLSDFSFYIAHNIQAGEMGVVNTDDEKIYKLIKKIKANGRLCDCVECLRYKGRCKYGKGDEMFERDPRFTHDLIGYNFKTTEFQTALASAQMKRADRIFKSRSDNVKYLNDSLEKFSDLLQLPVFSPDVSYLGYPMVIKQPGRISRKAFSSRLEKHGIETRPLFGCIPTQQPAYSEYRETYRKRLPNADFIGANGLYIGCHQYLKKEDLDYVVSTIEKAIKES